MLDKLSSLQHTYKENTALKNTLHPKGSILSDNNSLSSLLWIHSTVQATKHTALFHAATKRLEDCFPV